MTAHAVVPEAVVDVPTRGITQRILYLEPANPVANVILYAGGNGILRLHADGTGEYDLLESSAATRNRQRFAEQGFAVAVVDAPDDMQISGMGGFRFSTEQTADTLAVIRYMRARADVPVWLVGHDTGALSAVYAALTLPAEQPAGVVSLAGPAATMQGQPLRQLRRPVLVVSHVSDPCQGLTAQTDMFDDLEVAPVKLHVVFAGGNGNGVACWTSNPGAIDGYHGFSGLDAELVGAVADFARAYNPLVTPPATTATAVEFYHAGFDHYFVTWVAAEIASLDSGATAGWARTGQSFKVFATPQGGTSPVCRIYIPPGLGNGHFFGRDAEECDGTMRKNPSFLLESAAFFHLYPPSAGQCAAGQVPVYRAYSNRADANHRYTTDRATRDGMVASGWLAEGDGSDLVVMCAPSP
ncbi:MAG: hypothetical protein U1F58_02780 [Burkholderiales bacterium]